MPSSEGLSAMGATFAERAAWRAQRDRKAVQSGDAENKAVTDDDTEDKAISGDATKVRRPAPKKA